MQKLAALFRTTAVRLSALYLLLFAVCAVALVFYVTAMSEGLLHSQTREAVNGEVDFLGRAYRIGGITGLVRVVERRSRQPGANLYTIAAPTGEILAGNVASLQPGVLDREGWTTVPFRYERFSEVERDDIHLAMAQIIMLPNGMRLMVGRDLGEPENFRGLVRRALMIALGTMGVGALAIWFFVGRRALMRIDRMSAASQKIMAGDLSQRLPTSGSGDEFDRLSESLNTMLGRIDKLNEGLRQVSDNIAHDLKTPLTRLRNKAEAALATPPGDGGYRATLEEMIAESDQLIRTFNALLMISRVEAGSKVTELQPIDLVAVISDAAELYEPVAEDAGVGFELDLPAAARITGNRELIGQALSNLMDNAIKYAGETENARICVALADRGTHWCLSVEDNGPGVPPESYEVIVERFKRLDESRSKPGTGLGLSLVKAVAELHGGRLEFSPGSGNGDAPGLKVSMILPKGEQRG